MSDTHGHALLEEIVDGGVIQEANRRFFHVLGLELVVAVDPDEGLSLRVRDGRDALGGLVFEHPDPEWSEVRQARARKVDEMLALAFTTRYRRYGFDLQPIEEL